MGYIREYIERIIHLTENDWSVISSYFVKRTMCKNQKLIKAGETEKYLSFVEEGVLRYYIPGVEKELTFGFSFEKEFACAYDSFLTQTPSEYELEALTSSVIWCISYDDLQEVYTHTQTGNYWGRVAAERLYLYKSKREISLLKYSAKERYSSLLKE